MQGALGMLAFIVAIPAVRLQSLYVTANVRGPALERVLKLLLIRLCTAIMIRPPVRGSAAERPSSREAVEKKFFGKLCRLG